LRAATDNWSASSFTRLVIMVLHEQGILVITDCQYASLLNERSFSWMIRQITSGAFGRRSCETRTKGCAQPNRKEDPSPAPAGDGSSLRTFFLLLCGE